MGSRRILIWGTIAALIVAAAGVAWERAAQPKATAMPSHSPPVVRQAEPHDPPPAHRPAAPTQEKPAEAAKPKGSREIEICGIGKVSPSDKNVPVLEERMNRLTEDTRRRWLETLRNSDEYRARAAGLLMVSRSLQWEGMAAEQARAAAARKKPAQPPGMSASANADAAASRVSDGAARAGADRTAGSEDDSEPVGIEETRRMLAENPNDLIKAADAAREELVQLAAGAGDPAVYSFALSACDDRMAPWSAPCKRLSVRQWADLDSSNAVPWLAAAAEARKNHDERAEAELFRRASEASRYDSYSNALSAAAEPIIPADVIPVVRMQLEVGAIGIEALLPSGMGIVSQHCTAEALRDAETRRQCAAIAELQVDKGTTVLDLALGASVGRRVGWPPARLAALRDEKDALKSVWMEDAINSDQSLSCANVARVNTWLRDRSGLGELGAARERIQRSGTSVTDLAKRQRDFEANQEIEIKEAAANASAVP